MQEQYGYDGHDTQPPAEVTEPVATRSGEDALDHDSPPPAGNRSAFARALDLGKRPLGLVASLSTRARVGVASGLSLAILGGTAAKSWLSSGPDPAEAPESTANAPLTPGGIESDGPDQSDARNQDEPPDVPPRPVDAADMPSPITLVTANVIEDEPLPANAIVPPPPTTPVEPLPSDDPPDLVVPVPTEIVPEPTADTLHTPLAQPAADVPPPIVSMDPGLPEPSPAMAADVPAPLAAQGATEPLGGPPGLTSVPPPIASAAVPLPTDAAFAIPAHTPGDLVELPGQPSPPDDSTELALDPPAPTDTPQDDPAIPNLASPPSADIASAEPAPAPDDWVSLPNGGSDLLATPEPPATAATRPSQPDPQAMTTAATAPSPSTAGQIDPIWHVVQRGENFWTISRLYYGSGRYYKALWKANDDRVAQPDALYLGTAIRIPPPEQLDASLIEDSAQPASSPILCEPLSGNEPPESNVVVMRPSDPSPVDDQEFTESTSRTSTRLYTVEPHETLRSIARDQLGDSRRDQELAELNQDVLGSRDRLVPGLQIRLPLNRSSAP